MVPPVPLRRNRDFALLSTGRAASSLGSNVSGTAYPLIVLAMTGSAADAGLPAFALAPNPFVLGALFATMAFAGPIWNVASSAYAMTVTPDELLGRMQGVAWVVGLGGIPLGAVTVGYLIESIGTDGTALLLAGVMVVLALLATASRGIRGAPRWAVGT